MAVLEGDELVNWGVTGFRKQDARTIQQAVQRRVQRLIDTYKPDVLAIEEPSAVRLRMSPLLGVIIRQIRAVAVDTGVRFVAVAQAEVRERLCGSARATHAQMAERIVEIYPHLGRYCRGASQWQEDYWRPMFSAVGVVLL